ncbi:DUF1007 family protein [Lentilitoribacter sp. EG35]|uniref:DUF1007 family protein n=1 Tax=Lentilitoribacter sp. EG35 TaxID=3234192 RepID=UPI00346086C5
MSYLKRSMLGLCFFAGILSPIHTAIAHPHVFAESRLEIETSENGMVVELRHVWRFDEFFSASVVLDFDEDQNLELDENELRKIGEIVRQSLAEFDYYTNVTVDGYDFAMSAPNVLNADYVDGQLLLFFAMQPKRPLELKGKISAGVYDPTLYAAMEFINDEDLIVTGASADKCKRAVIRPDADEVIAQNQTTLTEAFYEDAENNDLSKLFATRIQLTC